MGLRMSVRGVYCAGNIVVDCLVRPVEAMPPWSTTTHVDSISLHLGGNGAATAYAAAMMGVPVRLAGAVGRDPYGEFALGRLRGAGADLAHVRTLDSTPTAATVGLVNAEGKRLFFHELGASGVFSGEDVRFDGQDLDRFALFHLGSIFSLPQFRGQARTLLERARAAGLVVSLDTDWDPEGRWMADFEPLCPLLDYLFLNVEEARHLAETDIPAEIAEFFQRRGAKTVVLKRGAAGCTIFTREKEFLLPAYDVTTIDTTGAGDCFCGGFLAGLCRGLSLEEAGRLGNALGACSVQKVGGTDGVLRYEETVEWMASADARVG